MPDQRPPELARDLDDPLVGLVLGGEAVLLDLEVHVVGAERLDQLVGVRPRLRRPGRRAGAGRSATAGSPVSTITPSAWAAICGEIDRRLAALIALEEAGRAQLDQVAVAGRRGRQQRQVEAVEPARRAPLVVVDDIRLAPEDRLDAVLAGGGEQLDRAVHHAVVGEADRRLIERRGPLDQGLDLARPVEQRILGVDVQMRAGRGHSRARVSAEAPALRA